MHQGSQYQRYQQPRPEDYQRQNNQYNQGHQQPVHPSSAFKQINPFEQQFTLGVSVPEPNGDDNVTLNMVNMINSTPKQKFNYQQPQIDNNISFNHQNFSQPFQTSTDSQRNLQRARDARFRIQQNLINSSPKVSVVNQAPSPSYNQIPIRAPNHQAPPQLQKQFIDLQYEKNVQLLNEQVMKQMQDVQLEHKQQLFQTHKKFINHQLFGIQESRQFTQLNQQNTSPRPITNYRESVSPIYQNRQSLTHIPPLRTTSQQQRLHPQIQFSRVAHTIANNQRDRDQSFNTINNMLDDSRPGSKSAFDNDFEDYQGYLRLENNPKKNREFYLEFCNAVQKTKRGLDINVHDILYELGMIGADTIKNQSRLQREGLEFCAISTEPVIFQKNKLNLPTKNDIDNNYRLQDEITRNLFKILCGVMNLQLNQRGLNPIDDQLLQQYIEPINFDLQDHDLNLINQLSIIKQLAHRKAFSLNQRQLGLIHNKFINFYEQRKNNEYQPQAPLNFDYIKNNEQVRASYYSINSNFAQVPNMQQVRSQVVPSKSPNHLHQNELKVQKDYRLSEFQSKTSKKHYNERDDSSKSNEFKPRGDSFIGKGTHYAKKDSFISTNVSNSQYPEQKKQTSTQNPIQDFLNNMAPLDKKKGKRKNKDSLSRNRSGFDMDDQNQWDPNRSQNSSINNLDFKRKMKVHGDYNLF